MKRLMLLIIPCIFLAISCNKKEDEPGPATSNNTHVNNGGGSSEYYVEWDMDGTHYKYAEGADDYANTFDDLSSNFPLGPKYIPMTAYADYWYASNSSKLANSIWFAIVKTATSPISVQAQYNALLTSGTYPLTGTTGGSDGAMIYYYDQNLKRWSTENGSQSGSSFNVTLYQDDAETVNSVKVHKKIRIEFNCKLYDGSGNVKTVTNGLVVGRIMTEI